MMLITTLTLSQTQINYLNSVTPISQEIIFNPERGFSKFSETNPEPNYSQLSVSTLNGYKNSSDKISVIYRGFYLPFTESIPQTYIDKMQIDFNRLRQTGLKAYIRFAYTRSTSCTSCQPTKTIILSHIRQLASVINNNKDVIVAIQGGFIGAYGEYYYTASNEFGTQDYTQYTQTQWNNRKEVFDLMLNEFDTTIPIQLRYPFAKVKMYGQSYIPRIGFFNDAFLNTYGDEGFFPIGQNASPSQQQVNEVLTQTIYEPMIGETNGASNRTNGPNAILEMKKYKWSIINKDYYIPVVTSWQNDGSYTDMLKQLGYRYYLRNASFNVQGDILDININCGNAGFTNLFKSRKVYLLLNETPYEIQTNNREWGSNFDLNIQINTSNLSNDTYDLYLWIPDNENQNIPEYSIQFANINVWQNGKNKLSYSFIKTSLGIEENNKTLNIYPNPSKNTINFPFELEYELYSINGQFLFKGFDNKINISELSNSIYFIKTKDYKTLKIIKI